MRVHAVHRVEEVIMKRRELRSRGTNEERRDESVEVLARCHFDVAQAALVPFMLLIKRVIGAGVNVREDQRIAAAVDDDRRLAVKASGTFTPAPITRLISSMKGTRAA